MFMAKGIMTALITPLNSDGSLCSECLSDMIEFQYRNGIEALYLTGTYGEGIIIRGDTRIDVYRKALEVAGNKMKLLPHVGATDIDEVVRLAKAAKDIGYSVVGVVGPIFHRPTRRGLIEFFARVARADVEIVIYNNKGRQGYNIGPEEFEAIANEVSSVVGIKDTSHDVAQLLDLVKRFGSKYFIAGGGDELIFYTFAIGAHAHICGISNGFPELAVEIYRNVVSKNYEKAIELQYTVDKIRKAIAKYGVEPQEVFREILKIRGIRSGYPPIQMIGALEPKHIEELKSLIDRYLPR